MKTHEFEFWINDPVTLKAIARDGVVSGLMVNRGGAVEVRVAYWWDGRREEEWMYPEEIVKK